MEYVVTTLTDLNIGSFYPFVDSGVQFLIYTSSYRGRCDSLYQIRLGKINWPATLLGPPCQDQLVNEVTVVSG